MAPQNGNLFLSSVVLGALFSYLRTLSQLDQFKSITPLSRKDLPCARMRLESTLGQVSVFRLDGGWPDSSHHSFLLALKAYKNQ
jgi:hypothetical protein